MSAISLELWGFFLIVLAAESGLFCLVIYLLFSEYLDHLRLDM